MKVVLREVGDRPPRSHRGKTFLPSTAVNKWTWPLVRIVASLLALVLAPLALPVAGWWWWGLRGRFWRAPFALLGVLSALGGGYLGRHHLLLAGVALWGHLLAHVEVAHRHLPAPPLSAPGLLAGGWLFGTVAGVWLGFLAWHRTPPWKDPRVRPMTLWGRWRKTHLERALAAGAGDLEGRVTFGTDLDTGRAVELSWAETSGHMLVVGSPGSGKTTTASRVVRASIRDGLFTAVVDMKASPLLVEQVADWCHGFGRPLWVFSLDGPSHYDPFASAADSTRKRDLLMATADWTDPFYQAKASDYLQAVFDVLDLAGDRRRGWLPRVSELLNPNLLSAALRDIPTNHPRANEVADRVERVVDDARRDPRALGGLPPRVHALTDTTIGRWVQPGEPSIDLAAIFDQGGVVLFSLPTLTHPDAAAAFGGLVVQDLKTLAGVLQGRHNDRPGLVFVDEFSSIGAANVASALAMSREGGLRFMLATQDLGDLAVGPDGLAFVQKVLTDTNVKIIHSVGDSDTAERLAKLAGTRWGVMERVGINQADATFDVTTSAMSGQGFISQELVPVIDPSDVLAQGMGAGGRFTLMSKTGGWVITHAHTIPDATSTPPDAPVLAPLHVPGRTTPALVDQPPVVQAPTTVDQPVPWSATTPDHAAGQPVVPGPRPPVHDTPAPTTPGTGPRTAEAKAVDDDWWGWN